MQNVTHGVITLPNITGLHANLYLRGPPPPPAVGRPSAEQQQPSPAGPYTLHAPPGFGGPADPHLRPPAQAAVSGELAWAAIASALGRLAPSMPVTQASQQQQQMAALAHPYMAQAQAGAGSSTPCSGGGLLQQLPLWLQQAVMLASAGHPAATADLPTPAYGGGGARRSGMA